MQLTVKIQKKLRANKFQYRRRIHHPHSKWREQTPVALPSSWLSMEIVNPPHSFRVTNLSQVPLGRRQIRVPKDHLAHNFYRGPWSGGVYGRMSPEIMGLQMNPHLPHLMPHEALTGQPAPHISSLPSWSPQPHILARYAWFQFAINAPNAWLTCQLGEHGGASCLGSPLSHYKSFLFLSGSPPEGLRKNPISWGFFPFTYYSFYCNLRER